MEPTAEQIKECYRICSGLIHLIRLDKRTGELYLLAGDNFQVLIRANGIVRYP
jgi:hypothetical protein